MTVPTKVSTTSANNGFTNSMAVGISGASAGYLIILEGVCDQQHTYNTPAGYTPLITSDVPGHLTQSFFYKTSDGTETTATLQLSSGSEQMIARSHVFSGWSGSAPIVNENAIANPDAPETTQVTPTATATTDAYILRCMAAGTGTDAVINSNPGTLIDSEYSGASTNHVASHVSFQTQTGPGAVGTANYTTAVAVVWCTTTILIQGSGGVSASSITTVTPDPILADSLTITINGTGFEAAQGTGGAVLSQGAFSKALTETAWGNTQITCSGFDIYDSTLTFGSATMTVTPNANSASTKAVTLALTSGYSYVVLTSVNTTAAYRLEATPEDIQVGSTIVYQNILYASGVATAYTVEVLPDATLRFDGDTTPGTYTFLARSRDPDPGDWGSGFSTVTVSILPDQLPPVMTAPAALSLTYSAGVSGIAHNNATLVAWLGSATAVDAQDGDVSANITNTLATYPNPLTAGTYTIAWSAYDSNDNTTQVTSTLTITQTADTVAPVLTVPAALSLSYAFGTGGVPQNNSNLVGWLGSATAVDAVSGNVTSSITNNITSLFNPIPAGTYTVTWTARDAANNAGTGTSTLTITQLAEPITMSGSTDFVVTRNELIEDAYHHLGKLEENEVLTDFRITYASRQLNKMLKAWANRGYHLWTIYEASLSLNVGDGGYSVGPGGSVNIPRARRILSARLKETASGNETPLTLISRKEYFDLPNKTTRGVPSQVYYDPQFTGRSVTAKGRLYVWPTLDSGTYTIEFTYEGYIQDFDASTNDTPLPSEWAMPISLQLAVLLAPHEKVTGQKFLELKALADEYLSDAESSDNDLTTGIQFGVCDDG